MRRCTLVVYVVLLIAVGCGCIEFRQERAKVTYSNPKYITNMTIFTRRMSRHEPYRTNLTGTTLMSYGNNVTFAFILRLKSGGDFQIVSKVCDCVKTKWMQNYMSKFTNVPVSNCPFPPDTYAYRNMELPPKNVPIPVMDGDYYCIMELYITATKEKIMQVSTLLHFDPYGSNKNKDKNVDNKRDKKG